MTAEASDRSEVWLRANVRPVAGLAVVLGLAAGAAVLASSVANTAPWLRWLVAGGCMVAATLLAAVARVSARPRLARAGDSLEIRLAPATVEQVPLTAVECIFRGTEPLADGRGEQPRFRVGTLVVRFAERAQEWRSRPTFRPWGTWSDGHAVIDGRWCEPLSRETVERIAAALLEAKRQAAQGGDA
ncbi:MAG: hypothetical protein ACKOCX_02850 [Planctomycetota bacterium]